MSSPDTAPTSPSPSQSVPEQPRACIWRILIALGIVLLIGLVARVALAQMVIAQHTPSTFVSIHGDTIGYLRLGERMYDGRPYGDGNGLYRNRGLIRPPGYPALYVATRAVDRLFGVELAQDLRPIVWPQIGISLVQVAATFLLALVALRSLAAGTVAGLIAALSPTGIAAASVAMPDSPFAACFAVGFLGLVLAARGDRRPRVLSLAGGALAVAALLKPAAIYWPFVAVPALLIVRGFQWSTFGDLRRLLLPLVIVVVTWTTFNRLGEHVRAYSIVAARNLRYDVVPKVELAAKLHRMPTLAEYTKHAFRSTKKDDLYLRQNNASTKLLYDETTKKTSEVLRARPLLAARVMASNLRSQVLSRYKLIHRQLRKRDELSSRIRSWYESTDTPLALALWYVPMLIALPLWWFVKPARTTLALYWLGFIYIALPLGSVANEGSRLLLAAEPMATTLVVAGIYGLGRVIQRLWKKTQAAA